MMRRLQMVGPRLKFHAIAFEKHVFKKNKHSTIEQK